MSESAGSSVPGRCGLRVMPVPAADGGNDALVSTKNVAAARVLIEGGELRTP
jgi:hypothetical protein